MSRRSNLWLPTANPSVAPGFAAAIGERAEFGGTVYMKTGAADTDWATMPVAGDHGGLSGLTDPDHPADAITYDNGSSGLAATDVQAAIDEIAGAAAASDISSYRHAGGSSIETWYWGNVIACTDGPGSKAITADTLYAVPFIAPSRGGTLDRIAVDVSVTGGGGVNMRLGIYNNTSNSNLYPSTLLLDAGAFTTSLGVHALTISQALTAGSLYWLALQSDGAPSVVGMNEASASHILGASSALTATVMATYLTVADAYGALPGTFPASGAHATGTFPGIAVRFSA